VTGFLASVRSAEEAALALEGGADIIDAKDPASGALGRVEAAALRAIVARVAGRRPVSATIGDLDLAPGPVAEAVAATAAAGADIVKIGIFPGARAATFAALRPISARGTPLVAVLFADRAAEFEAVVDGCAEAGFWGVMLDTAGKDGGGLAAHCPRQRLGAFLAHARERGLATGLAGSLGVADVAALAALGPDYLGFRSALTAGARADAIDPAALRAVRAALDAAQAGSSATATAGAMSAAAAASSGAASGTQVSKPR
jgi:(5-formylfuran-3-yl)methyl phosphate synthase